MYSFIISALYYFFRVSFFQWIWHWTFVILYNLSIVWFPCVVFSWIIKLNICNPWQFQHHIIFCLQFFQRLLHRVPLQDGLQSPAHRHPRARAAAHVLPRTGTLPAPAEDGHQTHVSENQMTFIIFFNNISC